MMDAQVQAWIQPHEVGGSEIPVSDLPKHVQIYEFDTEFFICDICGEGTTSLHPQKVNASIMADV